MALGLVWSSVCLCLFVSVLIYDRMGGFQSKNQFPVKGKVNSSSSIYFLRKRLIEMAQTIVITGGSQGMGKAVGRLLAEKGANVIIVARNAGKLEEALKSISVCPQKHFIAQEIAEVSVRNVLQNPHPSAFTTSAPT